MSLLAPQRHEHVDVAVRPADRYWPQSCEVVNSVGILRELSWLTKGMAKIELDCKAAGLRSAHCQDSAQPQAKL